jgi:hypothetical protein
MNITLGGGWMGFGAGSVALAASLAIVGGVSAQPAGPVSPASVLPPTFGVPGQVFVPGEGVRMVGVAGLSAKVAPQTPASLGEVEVVAEMDWAPGNVTVTPKGQILISAHPFGRPGVAQGERPYIAQVVPGGVVPGRGVARGEVRLIDQPWAKTLNPENAIGFSNIIGLRSDPKGVVYLLDMGQPAAASSLDRAARMLAPKIVIWDSGVGGLENIILLEGNARFAASAFTPKSFLLDLAVDWKRRLLYIADCGIGQGFDDPDVAIVVVSLDNGRSRRVLAGHPLLLPEPDARMVIDGVEVRSRGEDGSISVPRVGVNPIAIDGACEWVYFGSMHGTKVFKVRAEDLADELLTDEQLSARVSVHGPKPVSDGITIDDRGNIYITDVNASAIGVLTQAGEYRVIAQDSALLAWPDGLAVGPDGYVYATVNQLHRHAALNAGVSANKPPYLVVRVRVAGE